jgi:hypothetical protein
MSLKMGLSRFADTLLIRKGLLLWNGHSHVLPADWELVAHVVPTDGRTISS